MGQSEALHSLDEKQRRRRGCLGLHSLAEPPAGPGGEGAHAPTPRAGRRGLTHAFVRGPRGQSTAIEAVLTLVTEGPRRVVQATQAAAEQGVAVAHGVGVHVPTALAPLAGLGDPRESQRVPEEAIITDLTAPPWERRPCVEERARGPPGRGVHEERGRPRAKPGVPRGPSWNGARAPGSR